MKAVGKRPNKKSGRSAPRWTSKCKSVQLEYQAAVDGSERVKLAWDIRNTVASAKREYWKKKIEDIKSSQDVYILMRWGTLRHTCVAPPLRHEGQFISDQAERVLILRDCLLARFSALDDLPPCILSGEENISGWQDLTEYEVRTCTIGSSNTSPGADGISVEFLAACWINIESHVLRHFQLYFRLGYHPACFKLAVVVFLPKSGRDP